MDTVLIMVGENYPITYWHVAGLGLLLLGWLLGLAVHPGPPPGRGPAPQLKVAAGQRSASDDAFLRGVTHLMADHTDQAIEEFTKAVTLNSETVETYVVLGNLFRQKGEIDRAVRIRQSIIARPHLDKAIKLQALYDLGLDYRKGGLFNRAVDAFNEVLQMNPSHVEANRQMVSLYEEMRDWEKALEASRRLEKLTGNNNRQVQAHYLTELGKERMAAGQLDQAEDALSRAISVHKECLDAYLHLGDLEMARGRVRKALGVWRKAVRLAPMHAPPGGQPGGRGRGQPGRGLPHRLLPGDRHRRGRRGHPAQPWPSATHRHGEDNDALRLLELAVERAHPANWTPTAYAAKSSWPGATRTRPSRPTANCWPASAATGSPTSANSAASCPTPLPGNAPAATSGTPCSLAPAARERWKKGGTFFEKKVPPLDPPSKKLQRG